MVMTPWILTRDCSLCLLRGGPPTFRICRAKISNDGFFMGEFWVNACVVAPALVSATIPIHQGVTEFDGFELSTRYAYCWRETFLFSTIFIFFSYHTHFELRKHNKKKILHFIITFFFFFSSYDVWRNGICYAILYNFVQRKSITLFSLTFLFQETGFKYFYWLQYHITSSDEMRKRKTPMKLRHNELNWFLWARQSTNQFRQL